jgi:hypothetical protein
VDRDLLRDRTFDFDHKFLPDGLSRVDELEFLTQAERRSLSQVQGRTYAFLFGLVERFLGAKILDQSRDCARSDSEFVETPVRHGEAEIRDQDLFRRVSALVACGMPGGYATVASPNNLARMVLSKSAWAVVGLTCLIELFVQSHYEHSIEPDDALSPLFKDIFRVHWRDQCQQVILDEREWRRIDSRMTTADRDAAVTDLICLFAGLDRIMQGQAAVDSAYFLRLCDRNFTYDQQRALRALVVKAYRWQFIVSGVEHRHFNRLLTEFTTPTQRQRIQLALAPIVT